MGKPLSVCDGQANQNSPSVSKVGPQLDHQLRETVLLIHGVGAKELVDISPVRHPYRIVVVVAAKQYHELILALITNLSVCTVLP